MIVTDTVIELALPPRASDVNVIDEWKYPVGATVCPLKVTNVEPAAAEPKLEP